jgi:transcriptional regulator with XRE-family HTH domain
MLTIVQAAELHQGFKLLCSRVARQANVSRPFVNRILKGNRTNEKIEHLQRVRT